MHTSLKISVFFLAVLLAAGLTACGGGASATHTTALPMSVAIAQGATASTSDGQTMSLSASVANDSAGAGVQWSVSGGGSLSGQTTSAATYNAPTTGSGTATVTATSVADGTKSASIRISYSLTAAISVAITNKISQIQAAGSAVTLHARLQNDGLNQGVTWSLTAGGAGCSPTCGSLSGNAATSVTYTPPASVPAAPNNAVTITATSVADATKTDLDAFTIVSTAVSACNGAPSGSEALLTGQYTFLTQGFAGASLGTPVTSAASFTADGTGKITAGELDTNDTVTPKHLTINAAGSSYTVGSDHRGCITLANSGGTTSTFHIALGKITAGVAAKGRIIEFDDAAGTGTRAAGTIRLQDSSSFSLSSLHPNYAFGVDGWAFASSQWQHFAAAGSFTVNSAGVVSNGFADLDQGGSVQSTLSAGTGVIAAISTTTGRGTMTYAIGGHTFGFALYMINANEFFLASTDAVAVGPVPCGRAIVTASSFTASSLSGNYIVHVAGASGGTASATLGLLTLSSGSASGTLHSYDAVGGAASQSISGGTYAIDTTSGRVTFTGVGTHAPVAYVTTATDGVSAFIVGTDTDAIFGVADAQPSATYSASSLSGSLFFGVEAALDNTVSDQVGVFSAASGTLSGVMDLSGQSGLSTDQALNAVLTINADGTGTAGANIVAITNGTRLFVLDETSAAAKIVVAEQ
jgi:hypothetical protein